MILASSPSRSCFLSSEECGYRLILDWPMAGVDGEVRGEFAEDGPEQCLGQNKTSKILTWQI